VVLHSKNFGIVVRESHGKLVKEKLCLQMEIYRPHPPFSFERLLNGDDDLFKL
jgi:hypothetical protein